MQLWALLLAAGQGSRLYSATGGLAKQFLVWKNKPLFWHAAQPFMACPDLRGLVFVFPPTGLASRNAVPHATRAASPNITEGAGAEVSAEALDPALRALRDELAPLLRDSPLPWRVVFGGARRQDSVRLGLAALPPSCDSVLIHDTARPFASPTLVSRVSEALATALPPQNSAFAGVIPVVPVTDTIKVLCGDRVEQTPDRATLAAAQTPQGFVLDPLRAAHQRAQAEAWDVTDDASLLERCGLVVRTVAGEAGNRKITNPEDLAMLAATSHLPCTGYGYDVHRYADDPTQPKARPLRLGGELVPGPSVLAHSDGDVLLHAVMDAILGCLGQGDIGRLFPDSDPALDGIHSAVLLDEVLDRARAAELRLVHLDVTLVAQIPRISPYRDAIRKNLARLTGLALDAVNVKATTEEGLGFTGEKKGIKAVAVVSALKPDRALRP